MSHFSVLVIGENIEEQLQPYHEFECTGISDQYVVDVDKTEELLARMEGKGDYQNGEKESLEEALGYYGLEERIVGSEDEVDREGEHKFGFAIVQDGKLIKAVDRTNAPKFEVIVCPGLSNPTSEGIGAGADERTKRSQYSGGGEEVPYVWTDKTSERICSSSKESGWTVHILSPLHGGKKQGSISGASPEVALTGQIQNHSIGLSKDGGDSAGDVCHLSSGGGGQGGENGEVAGSGSRSCDWESEGTFVQSLQHLTGASGGQIKLYPCGSELPHVPHILGGPTKIGGSEWDWWVVGGRWTGYFKLKEGAEGEVGQPGLMTPRAESGWADSALKRDIDFDGMRDFEEAQARERHQTVVKWLGHVPNHTTWNTFRDRIGEGFTADQAREAYHAQPDLVRMKEVHAAKDTLTEKEYSLLSWLELDPFACTENVFAARARDRAISTFALVRNSQWFEKGSMGWFGMVSDEKDENEWVTEFTKLVDSLPEDTLLTVVDCHI